MKCPLPLPGNRLCEESDWDAEQIQAHLLEFHSEKVMLSWIMTEMLVKRERDEIVFAYLRRIQRAGK